MKTFRIEGGHKLSGSIQPQGAKNEALQILCAVLLTSEKIIINNIPDIIDVNKLIALLGKLGVKIEKLAQGSYSFQADEIKLEYSISTESCKPQAVSRKLRLSKIFTTFSDGIFSPSKLFK